MNNYLENAVNHYVVPGGDCVDTCSPVIGIEYDAQFWPIPLPGWGGLQGAKWNVSVQSGVDALNDKLDDAPAGTGTIFGYSQGATVVGIVKGQMNDPQNVTFFFIGNPQRPNGGLFERLAFLGTVPIRDATFGNPTPTDTCTGTCATDVALTYDGVVDSPSWLANPVAVLNALAGFQYVHGTCLAPDGDDPPTETPYGYTPGEVEAAIAKASAPGGCTAANYCQTHGDTIYITLPARYLPTYQPLIDLGDATGTSALIVPIVDLISPATQALIETGCDRSDYGNPTPGSLLPPASFNPIQVAGDLVDDIPEGINMALKLGHTPRPPPAVPAQQTTTTLADQTNEIAKTPQPPTRLPFFAKPKAGITATGAGGTNDRPLSNALKDFHPVRDALKAVSGTVNKALGKDDNAAKSGATTK